MKRIATVLLVVAVVIAGWFLYSRSPERVATVPEGYQLATVERGPIEAAVSASGSIKAARSQALTFALTGTVAEVLVSDGAEVSRGQALARLDATDLELNLKQAQAALEISEAQLERAQSTPTEQEIAAARAAVEAARASLAELQRGPSEREIELARLAIDQAKNSLWAAQGNRDAIKGNPLSSGGSADSAEAQVLNAELAVRQAEISYAQLLEPPSSAQILQAQMQVAQAESTLATLLSTPRAADVAVAEAQVAQARVGVEVAMNNLTRAVLRAPFSGYVSSIDLNPGDTVAPGTPVATLVERGSYDIVVAIDETEIGLVAPGQEAAVTLDAYPDATLRGRIAQVDLVGTLTQGIVTYDVTVTLEPTDLDLRPMMTAAVDIVVDRKEDALLVPARALLRDRQGYYVEELRNGAPARVPVVTGLASSQYTEVVEGLEEGQEIIVGRPRGNAFGGGVVVGGG
jgi:HlyD family secretion protein